MDFLDSFHYEWNFNLSKFISILSNYRANLKLLLPDQSEDVSPEQKYGKQSQGSNKLNSDGFLIPSPKVNRYPASPAKRSIMASSISKSIKIPRIDRLIDGVKPLSNSDDESGVTCERNPVSKSSSGHDLTESSTNKENVPTTFSEANFDRNNCTEKSKHDADDEANIMRQDTKERKVQDTNSCNDEWSEDGSDDNSSQEAELTASTRLPNVHALHALKVRLAFVATSRSV